MLCRKMILLGTAIACGIAVATAGPATAEEKEVLEKPIAWDEVPAIVQQTILTAAGDHVVKEVEVVHEQDLVYYETDWIEGENEVEIHVALDGKLLSSEVEAAEAEDVPEADETGPEHDDGD